MVMLCVSVVSSMMIEVWLIVTVAVVDLMANPFEAGRIT
jgi:hypothetical protein